VTYTLNLEPDISVSAVYVVEEVTNAAPPRQPCVLPEDGAIRFLLEAGGVEKALSLRGALARQRQSELLVEFALIVQARAQISHANSMERAEKASRQVLELRLGRSLAPSLDSAHERRVAGADALRNDVG